MRFLFNPESRVHYYLTRLVDLFILNVLFIVSCLPIVTIGSAMLALYQVSAKIAFNQDSSIVTDYLEGFKANLKRGIQLTLLFLFQYFLLMISFLAFIQLTGVNRLIGLFGTTMLTFFIFFQTVYLFPYCARYNDSLRNAYKNAYLIAFLNLKQSFFIGICFIFLGICLSWNAITFSAISLIIIFFGFSSMAVFISRVVNPVFQQYEPGMKE